MLFPSIVTGKTLEFTSDLIRTAEKVGLFDTVNYVLNELCMRLN